MSHWKDALPWLLAITGATGTFWSIIRPLFVEMPVSRRQTSLTARQTDVFASAEMRNLVEFWEGKYAESDAKIKTLTEQINHNTAEIGELRQQVAGERREKDSALKALCERDAEITALKALRPKAADGMAPA